MKVCVLPDVKNHENSQCPATLWFHADLHLIAIAIKNCAVVRLISAQRSCAGFNQRQSVVFLDQPL